jgi:hypothetical protein
MAVLPLALLCGLLELWLVSAWNAHRRTGSVSAPGLLASPAPFSPGTTRLHKRLLWVSVGLLGLSPVVAIAMSEAASQALVWLALGFALAGEFVGREMFYQQGPAGKFKP